MFKSIFFLEYKKTRASFMYRFKALLSRVYLTNLRNPQGILTTLFLSIIFSLMVGLIFLRIGKNTLRSIQDRLGALFFILINLGMGKKKKKKKLFFYFYFLIFIFLFIFLFFLFLGSIQALITTFALERPIFLKEYMGNQYSVTSYFFSNVFVLVPVSLVSPLLYISIVMNFFYFFIYILFIYFYFILLFYYFIFSLISWLVFKLQLTNFLFSFWLLCSFAW